MFIAGTCGTFIIQELPIIFLCFDFDNHRKCQKLQKRNDKVFDSKNYFEFETLFSLQPLESDSINPHFQSTLANYKGFPLALGGQSNSNLELFDTIQNQWIQKSKYPFATRYDI